MPAVSDSKYLVRAGWDDVPHLDEKTKAELLASTPPYLRDARARGIASLGAGAIYPVPWEEISVKPFAIPPFWRKGYGLDIGWNRTAAVWAAEDPADRSLYFYAEHYRGQAEPVVHASAIKARGGWIKGCIDPSARNRKPDDGVAMMALYTANGLHLTPANNEVEAGLYQMWLGFSLGRIKVFSTLQSFAGEYRNYHRDEDGKVVKKDDHLMDAARYLRMTWEKVASRQAPERTLDMAPVVSDSEAGY